ncbi:MAG: outer membrane lipid asymmetry maintenance protein MlaD, partial [Mariprofundaceae bacterium]|nr:outer membrane lipid asymmetry maintenance protein MlaD [Mariprofundaceae bacterium]
QQGVKLSTDAIAAVRTKGIIGERYVRISQGADDEIIEDHGEIEETESAINIEDLISKYIFSSSE